MSNTAEKLNEVLRGERAAAETYKQVLEKVGTNPDADPLRVIQSQHFDAVLTLKNHVKLHGEEPESSSGAWGTFAKSVVGSSKIFGDKAALKALKEGEEHGLKQYEELHNEAELGSNLRELVQNKFIPNQKRHIETIEQVINKIS